MIDIDERKRLNFLTVVSRPIPTNKIKQREQGGQKFDYISGETCISILNEATLNMGYDFVIKSETMVRSEPKALTQWNKVTKKKESVLDEDGNQKYEAQPPYVSVTAALTIPGFGTREQCGSSTLVGGASEQESGKKAAVTDALKKCCSLFGIGLQLYAKDTLAKDALTEEDITLLKEFKVKNNITSNTQLNPLVREFLMNYKADYTYLSHCNTKPFVDWYYETHKTSIETTSTSSNAN